jgi:geranylgeranyl diphosphate synthase type II
VTLAEYLAERRAQIDRTLDAQLPPAATPPAVIHEAMRYAVLGGGKRVRPILAIAAAEACGADPVPLLGHFAALELIHTYSLVHDDLPALDNDDYRRGRKTTHVVFGEAMGILTGDALLTEAFAWLARPLPPVDAGRQLRALGVVAEAVDSRGMIGGQVADIESSASVILSRKDGEGSQNAAILPSGDPSPSSRLRMTLEFIHRNKTGKLLTASVLLGGLLGNASDAQLAALENYGTATGLAFQIVDDLLDLEATSAELGKTAGKDVAQGKLTYPALLGVDAARAEAARLLGVAIENADKITGPTANYLAPMARYICERRS